MLMCIQNLVKFCPLVLKILSGNENYDGKTERRNDRKTERQKDRQGKSSIAPTFSKQGYNNDFKYNKQWFETMVSQTNTTNFLSTNTTPELSNRSEQRFKGFLNQHN